MDAKTRRLMKSKQGVVKTGSSDNPQEKDIRIENTPEGPMLFARLNGEWLKTPLLPADRVIPKIWTVKVKTTASSTGNYTLAKVPEYINLESILGMTLCLKNVYSSIPMYFWQPSNSADIANLLIGVRADKREIFAISAAGFGSLYQGEDLTLSILYK